MITNSLFRFLAYYFPFITKSASISNLFVNYYQILILMPAYQ